MKIITPKKFFLIITLLSSLISIIIIPSVNYLIDPLQFFRESKKNAHRLYQSRYKHYQRIKYSNFDYLLMGTSMVNAFDEAYASKILNGNIVKLNMAGSSTREQSLVIERAIKFNPRIKIIWELTLHVFSLPSNYLPPENIFPYWLYSETTAHDILFKYLSNMDTLKKSIKVLKMPKVKNDQIIRNTAHETALTPHVANVYLNRHKLMKKDIFPSDPRYLNDSYSKNILNLIKKYKNNEFILFFSPQSIYYFLGYLYIWKDGKNKILSFKKNVMESSFKHKNLQLFDFQSNKKLISNLNNYIDPVHHNGKIAEYIIKSIKSNKKLVTIKNYNNLLNTFEAILTERSD